ncbi:hypothetical protein KCTCHS21_00450 [Cohnella abietis]|uniref:Uncharacterized protein n=1 Tax=Cohnella abietis TaxID=2507935 RepID=A0A3T1CXT2_9BACL|nr:hypothetical protein KCTCHS21_00450 [Cohnella abietis]
MSVLRKKKKLWSKGHNKVNTKRGPLEGSLFIFMRIRYDSDEVYDTQNAKRKGFINEENGDRACCRTGQAHEIEII